jgi:beta-N-acetylhexosaminidase
MGCSKHFPGHGNTSVDSHYGLPTITTNKEDLYKTELAPFISAISNGIDSIMTTHIIFSAIDSKYPATLSEKVLTNLLREELGYDGLIITDGMEMGAVTNNFGGYDKTAVLAIKAGVDMLLYTSNNNPRTAHSALVQAVNNNEISIERINDSVRRILLKKLKYGLLDNYRALDQDISGLLAENEKLNLNFAMQSLTKVKGDFTSLDKNKSTLIISPSTSNDLGMSLESNSFANYASVYLKEKGHKKVDYVEIEKNISSSKASSILEMAKQYDQIVVAMSNTKTSSYSNSINFVNNLYKLNNDIVVVALDSPYDIIAYQNVNNYICVYGYQKATVIALTKYLNGEFEAKGVLALSTLK